MIITLTATVMKIDESVEVLYEEDFVVPKDVVVKKSYLSNSLDQIGSVLEGRIIVPDQEPKITIPSALITGEIDED